MYCINLMLTERSGSISLLTKSSTKVNLLVTHLSAAMLLEDKGSVVLAGTICKNTKLRLSTDGGEEFSIFDST